MTSQKRQYKNTRIKINLSFEKALHLLTQKPKKDNAAHEESRKLQEAITEVNSEEDRSERAN